MNMQPVVQTRSSANGMVGRRFESDTGNKQENKFQLGKSNPSRPSSTGVGVSRGEEFQSPSRDRLVYLTTCLIGHHVDVQMKNGSVYTGIFHATNAEKDFGVILKMARQTKSGSSRGQKVSVETLSKPPSKTFIIPANELVQVIAKDVSITSDGLSSDLPHDKEHEIMIDSSIAHSRHVEVERKLERWVPDEEYSQRPELDNIFEGPWNRSWDQFQVNEALFGVKSTFDEDLYTTKLKRGPQMREMEREAIRIAREIEGEDTQDLHLAEERGKLHDDFNFDEEARYSSVLRGVDDSGYEENEDLVLDAHNMETFESSTSSIYSLPFSHLDSEKNSDGAHVLLGPSLMDEVQPFQSSSSKEVNQYASIDPARHLISSSVGLGGESSCKLESQCNELKGGSDHHAKGSLEREHSAQEAQKSKLVDSHPSLIMKKDGSDKVGLSPDATAYDPSLHVTKDQEKMSIPSEQSDVAVSHKAQGETTNSHGRPGSSMLSTSDYMGAASGFGGLGLSPSSSVGSLTSERSTLNPHAKEFKLNPNAKSFVPSLASARPVSPVPEGSFYYPGASAVPHITGMPVGIGVGPSYAGHQPLIFNPQAAAMQSPQPYFHPNGPQYGQQMILGHPRQVMYMPGYPPEMQYKGRDY